MHTITRCLLLATLSWVAPMATAQFSCITGTVSLAPPVAAQVTAGGTLFVYVRELGREKGAPTAVVSIRNPRYPQQFQLCPADQMIPGAPGQALTGLYRVYARHSPTGRPMTQDGWAGSHAGEKGGGVRVGQTVSVRIDGAAARKPAAPG